MSDSPHEQLNKLEKEDRYLFHGSGLQIGNFKPQQAYTIVNEKRIPDGKPAVFASSFIDYAIFMALINKENCPKGFRSGVSYNKGIIIFRATKKTLEQLTSEKSGYVYVFDKKDFIQRNRTEWVSYKEVKPVSVIIISLSDFNQKVEEIKEK